MDIIIPEGHQYHKEGDVFLHKLNGDETDPILLFKPDMPSDFIKSLHLFDEYGNEPVIPLHPTTGNISINTELSRKTLNITRIQYPALPGYAITDYKAQGSTFQYAIVDFTSIHAAASAYVMLSRLKARIGLCILNRFNISQINRPVTATTSKLLNVLNHLKVLENKFLHCLLISQ